MAEEKNLEKKVKAYLGENNIWYLKTWSNGIQRSGVPDIIACCHGIFLGIELKAQKGKLSELQRRELKKIDETGGYAILLRPTDFELFKSFIQLIKIVMCGADNPEAEKNAYDHYLILRSGWYENETL